MTENGRGVACGINKAAARPSPHARVPSVLHPGSTRQPVTRQHSICHDSTLQATEGEEERKLKRPLLWSLMIQYWPRAKTSINDRPESKKSPGACIAASSSVACLHLGLCHDHPTTQILVPFGGVVFWDDAGSTVCGLHGWLSRTRDIFWFIPFLLQSLSGHMSSRDSEAHSLSPSRLYAGE